MSRRLFTHSVDEDAALQAARSARRMSGGDDESDESDQDELLGLARRFRALPSSAVRAPAPSRERSVSPLRRSPALRRSPSTPMLLSRTSGSETSGDGCGVPLTRPKHRRMQSLPQVLTFDDTDTASVSSTPSSMNSSPISGPLPVAPLQRPVPSVALPPAAVSQAVRGERVLAGGSSSILAQATSLRSAALRVDSDSDSDADADGERAASRVVRAPQPRRSIFSGGLGRLEATRASTAQEPQGSARSRAATPTPVVTGGILSPVRTRGKDGASLPVLGTAAVMVTLSNLDLKQEENQSEQHVASSSSKSEDVISGRDENRSLSRLEKSDHLFSPAELARAILAKPARRLRRSKSFTEFNMRPRVSASRRAALLRDAMLSHKARTLLESRRGASGRAFTNGQSDSRSSSRTSSPAQPVSETGTPTPLPRGKPPRIDVSGPSVKRSSHSSHATPGSGGKRNDRSSNETQSPSRTSATVTMDTRSVSSPRSPSAGRSNMSIRSDSESRAVSGMRRSLSLGEDDFMFAAERARQNLERAKDDMDRELGAFAGEIRDKLRDMNSSSPRGQQLLEIARVAEDILSTPAADLAVGGESHRFTDSLRRLLARVVDKDDRRLVTKLLFIFSRVARAVEHVRIEMEGEFVLDPETEFPQSAPLGSLAGLRGRRFSAESDTASSGTGATAGSGELLAARSSKLTESSVDAPSPLAVAPSTPGHTASPPAAGSGASTPSSLGPGTPRSGRAGVKGLLPRIRATISAWRENRPAKLQTRGSAFDTPPRVIGSAEDVTNPFGEDPQSKQASRASKLPPRRARSVSEDAACDAVVSRGAATALGSASSRKETASAEPQLDSLAEMHSPSPLRPVGARTERTGSGSSVVSSGVEPDGRVRSASAASMLALCRICEEFVPMEQLEEHSRQCVIASNTNVRVHGVNEKIEGVLRAVNRRAHSLLRSAERRSRRRREKYLAIVRHLDALRGAAVDALRISFHQVDGQSECLRLADTVRQRMRQSEDMTVQLLGARLIDLLGEKSKIIDDGLRAVVFGEKISAPGDAFPAPPLLGRDSGRGSSAATRASSSSHLGVGQLRGQDSSGGFGSSHTSGASRSSASARTRRASGDGRAMAVPSVDDFDILAPISKGGYGKVLLCRKKKTGDLYALKVLNKKAMVRKNQVDHVRREKSILAMTQNPHVVRLYYSFQDKDNLFLVMEFVPGGDLLSLLMNVGYIDEDDARFYIAETLLAVEYLHSVSIVHRDLKPDNLLITRDGHVKLTDFGLSKLGVVAGRRDDEAVSGTLDAVPPPQTPNAQQATVHRYRHRRGIRLKRSSSFDEAYGKAMRAAKGGSDTGSTSSEEMVPAIARRRTEGAGLRDIAAAAVRDIELARAQGTLNRRPSSSTSSYDTDSDCSGSNSDPHSPRSPGSRGKGRKMRGSDRHRRQNSVKNSASDSDDASMGYDAEVAGLTQDRELDRTPVRRKRARDRSSPTLRRSKSAGAISMIQSASEEILPELPQRRMRSGSLASAGSGYGPAASAAAVAAAERAAKETSASSSHGSSAAIIGESVRTSSELESSPSISSTPRRLGAPSVVVDTSEDGGAPSPSDTGQGAGGEHNLSARSKAVDVPLRRGGLARDLPEPSPPSSGSAHASTRRLSVQFDAASLPRSAGGGSSLGVAFGGGSAGRRSSVLSAASLVSGAGYFSGYSNASENTDENGTFMDSSPRLHPDLRRDSTGENIPSDSFFSSEDDCDRAGSGAERPDAAAGRAGGAQRPSVSSLSPPLVPHTDVQQTDIVTPPNDVMQQPSLTRGQSTSDADADADVDSDMDETIFRAQRARVEKVKREQYAPKERQDSGVIGTPDYLAPEILLGQGHGSEVDWWALGVVLFELLSGVTPFAGSDPEEVFSNILSLNINWEVLPEEVSDTARDLIRRLIEPNPEKRLGHNGASEIKTHPFFQGIEWNCLLDAPPPFVPELSDEKDLSYFDGRTKPSINAPDPYVVLYQVPDQCAFVVDETASSLVHVLLQDFDYANVHSLAQVNREIAEQDDESFAEDDGIDPEALLEDDWAADSDAASP